MYPMPGRCPVCQQDLTITELQCRTCDTSVRGHFTAGVAASIDQAKLPALKTFAKLSPEQLAFVEIFVKNEGKITRVEEEMNLSYPTVRARLNEVIRALGHQPREEQQEAEQQAALSRAKVLEELATGSITADEAVKLLRGR